MSITNQSVPNKLLYSIDNRLKSGFQTLCCKLENASSSIQLIPVYEYQHLAAPTPTASSLDDLYYQISGTTLSFAFKSPIHLFDNCSVSNTEELIQTLTYEDSLGNIQEANGPVSINFANFPSYNGTSIALINARLTIALVSGLIYSVNYTISTDGSGVPSLVSDVPYRSNTNTNLDAVQVNLVTYKKSIADLLEVWVDGVFTEYVDMDHNPYVPTYCLSYEAIKPFITYNAEPIVPVYNTNTHVLLSNNQTITIPANSAHSVSFTIMSGTCNVTLNGSTVALSVGINETIDSTTLISSAITITAPTGSNSVYVKVNKP